MKPDERGLPLSTDSTVAAASFDRAVEHFLKFHADTMTLAARALSADPGFVMGHCLKAYLLLIAANSANKQQTDTTLASAHAGAAGITPRERLHLAAADAWQRGALDESFRIWTSILDAHPTDLLAFRISDTIWRLISFGAAAPGTRIVEMTRSARVTRRAIISALEWAVLMRDPKVETRRRSTSSERSMTVTSTGRRATSCAAVRPPKPAPIMTTFGFLAIRYYRFRKWTRRRNEF